MIRRWMALAAVVGSLGLFAGCSSSGASVSVGVYGNPYGCYSCYGDSQQQTLWQLLLRGE